MFIFDENTGLNVLHLTLTEASIFVSCIIFFIAYLTASIVLYVKKKNKYATITTIVTIFVFMVGISQLILSYGGEKNRNCFDLKPAQAEELMVALTVFAVIAMLGLAIHYAKRQHFKSFAKYVGIFLINYAIGTMIYHLIVEFSSSGDIQENKVAVLICGIVVVLVAVVAVVLSQHEKTKKMFDAKSIAYAAICLAVCFSLSYIRLFRMPTGGSVTLASLMLLGLYSYMFGIGRGFIVAVIYGILQFIQGPYVMAWWQVILEYPVAFGIFGIVGIFRGRLKNIYAEFALGMLIAIVFRYICHAIASATVFFDNSSEMTPIVFALTYNIYVFVDGAIAITAGCLCLVSKEVKRMVLNANTSDSDDVEFATETANDDNSDIN